MLQNPNLHPYQPKQCLNLENYPSFIQNNIYNILNQSNQDQNVYPHIINNINHQNALNNNPNLLQNLTNYLNLKNHLNNQTHLNQNQIFYDQNHLNLINNLGTAINLFPKHNLSDIVSPNINIYPYLNQNNLSNNILSNNNNFYLNEANFNSAYKIEKKNNEDIQFNLLNESGRKIIITSEVNLTFI